MDSVDKVIESFMSKDYIRIREIDSFLAFPSVGYEWNEYMLESFLISYSKKFVLLNNGQSLHNVAGAIVKKDGKIKEKQIDESVKRILKLKLNRKIIK